MMKEVADYYLLEMNDRFPECGAKVLEYAYANMLDPRYKGSTLHGIGQRYNVTKISLKEAVFNMCKAELRNTLSLNTSQSLIDDTQQDTMTQTQTQTQPQENTTIGYIRRSSKSLMVQTFGKVVDNPEGKTSLMTEIKAELENYLTTTPIADNGGILCYLKNQSFNYPKLARFPGRILAIPAASSSSEQMFSTAGNICGDRRTNLSASKVEKLVYIKENLRQMKKMNNVSFIV